jgi:hypothetical protein
LVVCTHACSRMLTSCHSSASEDLFFAALNNMDQCFNQYSQPYPGLWSCFLPVTFLQLGT